MMQADMNMMHIGCVIIFLVFIARCYLQFLYYIVLYFTMFVIM